MRAMVLAAGLGTRLRPLTDSRPKALVELNGRTLLEITLERLRGFGIEDVVINAHHFADLLIEHLRAHDNFGMRVAVSREPELLDTGGGLKQAASLLLRDGYRGPVLVHNVDVLSAIDLNALLREHDERRAMATLAVQHRQGSRQLLFDSAGLLCGRHTRGREPEIVRPAPEAEALAFCGVHVLAPEIFSRMDTAAVFPIIGTYLRLAGENESIRAYHVDGVYWRDLGTAASLQQAAADLAAGVLR
ncbi:MAG: sugar phosphate nucleotidyltransferase [Acidobacteriota bacterium]|nr:sugar phosphate nucleotidyltransferase [Acidobacteriota bacterium]